MPKLPKSVVLDGRRYPTWALSAQARAHLVSIHEVEAHISALKTQLDYQHRVRGLFQAQLNQALTAPALKNAEPRYFWHTVPAAWFKAHWPVDAPSLPLDVLGADGLYQAQDRLVLYAKGCGVIGWGVVREATSGQVLEWRCRAHVASAVVPAKTVKHFAMRHPTRLSQRIPTEANIDGLLNALASNVALA